jgi:FkbM family methyltransferase
MNILQFLFKVQRRLLFHATHLLTDIQGQSLYSFQLADGSRFDYPLKSEVGRGLFMGSFEKTEINFIRQKIKPGDVFLDIGANAGLYTVIVSKIVGPTGHVYAFEPGERELELLQRNITNNNLANVTIVKCAVSNKKSEVEFAISHDGAMNSLSKTNHPAQKIKEWKTVQTTTIDDFMQDFNVPQINFIKIDVEGAEHLVFEGASKLLSTSKEKSPAILFECCDLTSRSFGYKVVDFLQELTNAGLNISVLDRDAHLVDLKSYQKPEEIGNKTYNFVATI